MLRFYHLKRFAVFALLLALCANTKSSPVDANPQTGQFGSGHTDLILTYPSTPIEISANLHSNIFSLNIKDTPPQGITYSFQKVLIATVDGEKICPSSATVRPPSPA